MKNIFILSAIITTLLFIACGNSTQKEKPIDKKQVEQFTPEEIAYNDSIKDIPMDYAIVAEYERILDIDNPSEIERIEHIDTVFLIQKDAYLKAYYSLCFGSRFLVSSRYKLDKFGNTELTYKLSMKILNKEGKDIAPLVNFPNRRMQEDSLWQKAIDSILELGVVDIVDLHRQPIINKGDTLVIAVSTEPASK